MKYIIKYVFLICILLSVLMLSTACFDISKGEITYVYNSGEDQVFHNAPEAPTRKGYVFAGWYTDPELTKPYGSDIVSGDITLYAKWENDYAEIADTLSSQISKACVKISAEFYGNFSKSVSQGSGVVFKQVSSYFYILTNNHVVQNEATYSTVNYFVYDAFGNVYSADLIASDPDYDLAVLRIEKNSKYIKVIEFETDPISKNETVISLTAPKGQYNVMSFGKIEAYDVIDDEYALSEFSNITFKVYWATTNADVGSSGGALFNADLKLVGINYAVGKDKYDNVIYSFIIPMEKIQEFLDKNEI